MIENQSEKSENLVSLSEASNLTGYHQDYLGFLCRSGKLKGFKVGRNWSVTKTDLEDFIKNYKNGISEVTDETGQKIPIHITPGTPAVDKVQSQEFDKPTLADLPAPLLQTASDQKLGTLKKQVLDTLQERISTISKNVAELEEVVEHKQAEQEVVAPLVIPMAEQTSLRNKFSPTLPAHSLLPLETQTTQTLTAAGVLAKDKIKKLFDSFQIRPALSKKAVVAASLVAALGFVGSIFISFLLSSNRNAQPQLSQVIYQHTLANSGTANTLAVASSTQSGTVIVNRSVQEKSITQVISEDPQQLYALIDQRLNQDLTAGKFTGPQGETGPQGQVGPAGEFASGNSSEISYVEPASGSSGTTGSVAGYAQLSTEALNVTQANLASLDVQGSSVFNGSASFNSNVSLNGTTTISNLSVANLNPGFAQGSVVFQGASGLAQDNSNLYYTASTSQLSLGTTTPNASALLELDSTNKGFLAPRMTQAQRDAIVNPATGLFIFDTTSNGYEVFNGTAWAAMGSSSGNSSVATGTPGSFSYYSSSNQLSPQNILFINSTNIGIGTTSPAAQFAIQATGSATSLFTVASSSGAQLVSVLANGDVAIGTTSPVEKLTVQGNVFVDSLNDTPGLGGIMLGDNNSFAARQWDLRESVTGENFGIDNFNGSSWNNALTILRSSANVGIGTTTPTQTLSVAGNFQLTGSLFDGTNASGTIGMVLQTTGTGTRWIATSSLGILSPQYFSQNGSSIYNNTGYELGINSSTPTANLVVEGSSNNPGLPVFVVASSSNASFLAVTATGNVGIGTNTPPALLSVQGTGVNLLQVGNNLIYASSTATTGGFVGVGTGVPYTSSDGLYVTSGDIRTSHNLVSTNGVVYAPTFAAASGYNLQLGTYNSPYVYILGSQTGNYFQLNFGIGTSAPSSLLYVQNTAAANTSTLFTVASATGASLFGVNYNGTISFNGQTGTNGQILQSSGSSASPTWVATSTLGFVSASSLSGTNGQVAYFTSGSNITSASDLLNNGTVAGINATSSTINFLIQGTGSNIPFQVNSSTGASLFAVTPTGNVGIGTTTVPAKLTIADDGATNYSASINLGVANLAQAVNFAVSTNNGPRGAVGYDGSNVYLVGGIGKGLAFYSNATGGVTTGNTAQLFLNTAGNFTFGFNGSTQATSTIGVNGNLAIGNSYFGSMAPLNGLIVQGNVGIGTTTPSARLSLTGTSAIDPFDISSTSGASLFHINANGAEAHNGSYGSVGQVLLSNGSGSSPTWVSTSTLGIICGAGTNLLHPKRFCYLQQHRVRNRH